jgi:hypothetical protein
MRMMTRLRMAASSVNQGSSGSAARTSCTASGRRQGARQLDGDSASRITIAPSCSTRQVTRPRWRSPWARVRKGDAAACMPVIIGCPRCRARAGVTGMKHWPP